MSHLTISLNFPCPLLCNRWESYQCSKNFSTLNDFRNNLHNLWHKTWRALHTALVSPFFLSSRDRFQWSGVLIISEDNYLLEYDTLPPMCGDEPTSHTRESDVNGSGLILRRKKPEVLICERSVSYWGDGPLNPPCLRLYKKLKGTELVSEFV
jgi:hypothetical protein